MKSRRKEPLEIAIVGAGPIGIETALYALALGHRPTVFEAGSAGENLKRFGFVDLFSPWRLNTSRLGLQAIRKMDLVPTDPEVCPTAAQFREGYILPLCRHLGARVRCRTRVLGIARSGLLKGDAIGAEERRLRAFRLLLQRADGCEESALADCVVDASGVYQNPGALGDGGVPAPGERAAADRIEYHLPDVLGSDRARFAGKTVLLVGAGYSAGTVVVALSKLVREIPNTRVVWARRDRREQPLPRFPSDPLRLRDEIAAQANAIASVPPESVVVLSGATVERIEPSDGRLRVSFLDAMHPQEPPPPPATVDSILALVGYRPDNGISRELQMHVCYASEGPMKLAAALLGTSGGGDCLAQPSFGSASLVNPEPGFFVLGHKSYGRRSDFLLKAGREQVRDLFRLLEGDDGLDLYTEGPPT